MMEAVSKQEWDIDDIGCAGKITFSTTAVAISCMITRICVTTKTKLHEKTCRDGKCRVLYIMVEYACSSSMVGVNRRWARWGMRRTRLGEYVIGDG